MKAFYELMAVVMAILMTVMPLSCLRQFGPSGGATEEAPGIETPYINENETAPGGTDETQLPATQDAGSETKDTEGPPAPSDPFPDGFHLSMEEYPKIDGATAMYPMSVEIAMAVIGLSEEDAEDFITHNTTSKAYYNLIDGTADLIFVSEPSDDILNRAKEAGVEFEMVGIGRDGFVFIVNQENPVKSLTIEQIQKIYTGEIKNWSEVGGEEIDIIPYQREANSGSQNLMEKMVMKGLPMMDAPVSFVIESMSGLIDVVASFSNSKAALGYSIYLYAKDQYVKDSIKFLSINDVYPTDDTIADGSYPLSKIVYAVFRSDEPEDSNVRKLVEWLRTEEGQEPVEAGGYVGLK